MVGQEVLEKSLPPTDSAFADGKPQYVVDLDVPNCFNDKTSAQTIEQPLGNRGLFLRQIVVFHIVFTVICCWVHLWEARYLTTMRSRL